MKAVRILLASAIAVALALSGAAAAGAAPTPTSIPQPCSTVQEVTIEQCQAHIMSSTTTPFQGQTIEVSGKTYHANEAVTLTIGGIFVGTAHTDANGNFDPPAVVPVSLLGDQPLTGRGASGQANDVDSLVLHITAAGVEATGSTSGLPNTGVDILTGVAVAIALIGAGILFTRGGRRRRSSHS